MAKLILYGLDASPPVRACLLTLHALNLPYEFKIVDCLKGEQYAKEYLAKNPQHTIPTLEDEDVVIWDSHAIMIYLVTKYGKNDTLYPNDCLQRAVVNQRLHFETGVMFQDALVGPFVELVEKNLTTLSQSRIDAVVKVYDFLEKFLTNRTYVAGDHLTIADFSTVTTVTALESLIEIDPRQFKKLTAWIKRMEELPYYAETNEKGTKEMIALIKTKNFTVVP